LASVSIPSIQGASHISPLNGQQVSDVAGIVTAIGVSGFYLQNPSPDAEFATSEGIYIYTVSAPYVAIGDAVEVDGMVNEFRPGGDETNLTITEIVSPTITVLSSGNPLPSPVVLGLAGRSPPDRVIDNDAQGDVEISGSFDPATDGIDFYESLESMLVQIQGAVVVAPKNSSAEIALVGDGGAHASDLSSRGSLVIQPGDYNPERLILDNTLISGPPPAYTGMAFSQPITGVVGYSYGNYKIYNTVVLPGLTGGVISETTEITRSIDQITIATINVENLEPGDSARKYARLANEIIHHLDAPDLLVLQEVQDNSGAVNDSVVEASLTYQTLIAAIQQSGGPDYQFRDIPPQNDQDGGQPGANIRVGFLFRIDRGLAFIDRHGGDAVTPVSAHWGLNGLELSISPGRIDPLNSAFTSSRKPLVGEFEFLGEKIFVIGLHLNSKIGDQPLFGRYQPPEFSTETKRVQQAMVVNTFVQSVLALDPNARVVVLGDMNDFQFSSTVTSLAEGMLYNLTYLLQPAERYTYLFDGNAEALDHILVSCSLYLDPGLAVDIVHMNAEFYETLRPTDHDPVMTRLGFQGECKVVDIPLLFRQ
jgi:predicted extracellular nuclease